MPRLPASLSLSRTQVLCQVLRILSFLSTQLPAPAPHCRAPEPTSNVPWPVVSSAELNLGRASCTEAGQELAAAVLLATCAPRQLPPAAPRRALLPPPQWWQVIFVNVLRQASKGCGDLIFSR